MRTMKTVFEEYLSLAQSVEKTKDELLEQLEEPKQKYFAAKIKQAQDFDERRDFASLRNSRDFKVDKNGAIVFTAHSYGHEVSHAVTIDELLNI